VKVSIKLFAIQIFTTVLDVAAYTMHSSERYLLRICIAFIYFLCNIQFQRFFKKQILCKQL